MRGMTDNERIKVHEITNRLAMLSSPVLRLQAILQFSQIVDILSIGDTCGDREKELINEVDVLSLENEQLKAKERPAP